MSPGDMYLELKRRCEELEHSRNNEYEAARDERDEAIARAEQAERERDEALRALAEAKQALGQMRSSHKAQCDARERAEADSAALLKQLREQFSNPLGPGVGAATSAMLETAHPGAALLERLRKAAGYEAAWENLCGILGVPHDANLPDIVHDMLERLRALEGVVAAFREKEWARGDWQGFCPFRRHKNVGCLGTDGKVSALGTPTPVPHAPHCPYHLLNAADALKERG